MTYEFQTNKGEHSWLESSQQGTTTPAPSRRQGQPTRMAVRSMATTSSRTTSRQSTLEPSSRQSVPPTTETESSSRAINSVHRLEQEGTPPESYLLRPSWGVMKGGGGGWSSDWSARARRKTH